MPKETVGAGGYNGGDAGGESRGGGGNNDGDPIVEVAGKWGPVFEEDLEHTTQSLTDRKADDDIVLQVWTKASKTW